MSFDYDSSLPLDAREGPRRREHAAEVQELEYASPRGGRVTASLVSSAGATGPGIVFLHWGFGDRRSFLPEAAAWAHAGATALLLDAPGVGGRGRGLPALARADVAREFLVQCVTDVRRGIDLLLARGLDPGRIAYVGHSLGATVGGPLAGSEPRLAAAVLMAGLGDVSRGGWSLRPDEGYRETMRPLDGTSHVGRARARILFQFAERDVFVDRAAARRFADAAAPSARVVWYDADHRLDAAALRDRAAWLGEQLALAPPDRASLAGVGLPRRDVLRYRIARPFQALASRWIGAR